MNKSLSRSRTRGFYSPDQLNIDATLKLVDESLYEAKTTGRNRVVVD